MLNRFFKSIPRRLISLSFVVSFIILGSILFANSVLAQVPSLTYAGAISNGGNSSLFDGSASVAVSGNYAYVVSALSDNFTVVDISNPASPFDVSTIYNGDNGALLDRPLSIAVFGDYAYIASSDSDALEIIDISNPLNPVHAGSLVNGSGGALLDSPWFVVVSGNYAYIASYYSDALEIVDVSNPSSPTHVGSISNGSGGAILDGPISVYVSGNYAYVTSYQSDALEIIDISNPSTPVHAGSLSNGSGGALLDGIRSVYVSGDYAYVASYISDSFGVIDISNPANPINVGTLTDGTNGIKLNGAMSVYVSGDYAYVAAYQNDALSIINISTPSNPIAIASLSKGGGGEVPFLDGARTVVIAGNYAYVASYIADALEIVDISIPTSPAHVGAIDQGYSEAVLDGAADVFVSGSYAYVASTISDALEIVDISNSFNPVHVASLINGADGANLRHPTSIFTLGNYAYVTSEGYSNSGTLEIVDISNPTTPTHISTFFDGDGGAKLRNPSDIYVVGNYAYVASFGSSALEIVNISNPTNPTHAGSIVNGTDGAILYSPKAVYVSGNYAYIVSDYDDALEIIDISNPSSPTHVGSLVDGVGGAKLNNPMDIYIAGNYAYIASYDSSALEIVDISNPASPTHVGDVTSTSAQSVFVSGDYAYVSNRYYDGDFRVFDVSDPANPIYIDGLYSPKLNDPVSVFISNGYAYIADQGDDLLEVVDIFSPPTITLTSPGDTNSCTVADTPTLTWSASDPDNGPAPLSFSVYHSRNYLKVLTLDVSAYQGTTSNQSYDMTNLRYNTTYYWRVVADDSNMQVASDIWSYTTQTCNPDFACCAADGCSFNPGNLTVSFDWCSNAVDNSIVKFTRSVSGGIEPYVNDWDFNDSTCPAGSDCSKDNPVHDYASLNNYIVDLNITDSVNTPGCFTDPDVDLTASPPTCVAGFNFTAVTALNSSQLILQWDESQGSNSYNIYRSDNGGSTYSQISSSPVSSTTVCSNNICTLTDTNLAPGTTYYYYLVATPGDTYNSTLSPVCDGATASPSSPCALFGTTKSDVSGLTFGTNVCGQITIEWNKLSDNPAEGEYLYNLYRSVDNGNNYTAIYTNLTCSASPCSQLDKEIIPNRAYYYKVTSVLPVAGESPLADAPVGNTQSFCYKAPAWGEN